MTDVIGGKLDGHKLTLMAGRATAYTELQGEPYIALEFPIDEKDKRKTVTIYMRCGMAPLDAMMIWRLRHKKGELLHDKR